MIRALLGLLVLGGVFVCLSGYGELQAQSKKKMTGPVVTLNGQKSQTFDYFKEAKPAAGEKYRFTFPTAAVDKDRPAPELVIQPATGSDDGLIDSWKKKFTNEPTKAVIVSKDLKSGGGANIKFLDVWGYLDKKPEENKKLGRFRLLGALMDVKGEKYEVLLLGPSATVGQILPDFEEWLKNFK
jgi:hypothetical protein